MESSYRDYSYYNTIMAYYYANKNTNTINYLQNIHKIYPETTNKYLENQTTENDEDHEEILNDNGFDLSLYKNSFDNNISASVNQNNYDSDYSDYNTERMENSDDDLSTILDDFIADFHDLDLENFDSELEFDFDSNINLQITQNLYGN